MLGQLLEYVHHDPVDESEVTHVFRKADRREPFVKMVEHLGGLALEESILAAIDTSRQHDLGTGGPLLDHPRN